MPKDLQTTKQIAERLIKLRRITGLTQDAVATAVGIGRTNYSHYETATACPPPHMLARLASVFDVSVDFLLGREQLTPTTVLRDSGFPLFDDMTEQLSRLKDDELALVLQYRQLTPEQKRELFTLTDSFLNEDA